MSQVSFSLAKLQSAARRIRLHVRKTPLEQHRSLSQEFGAPIFLKMETWQKTGSFKLRGAVNKLLCLSDSEAQQGVITASAGNHGLGVAYAASLLKIKARIVVPVNASPAKIRALQAFDVELIKRGVDYDEAEQIAVDLQKAEGGTFVHAFSDPDIIAGQGTIGLEILQQLPNVETVLVPIGGGGLISGVAAAIKTTNPEVRVIGVQSEASPAMQRALKAGRVVETPIDATLADGLAGRFVTEMTLNLTAQYVDDVVLVSESAIADAIKLLLETEHVVVEGSAAVTVAALLEGKLKQPGRTVCVLTGRNIDIVLLRELL